MDIGLRLEFHNDKSIHNQIRSKTAVQFYVIVDDWHRAFFLNGHSSFPKLISQTRSIRGFQ